MTGLQQSLPSTFAPVWTEPISYPGDVRDIYGQIVGPNLLGEHYVIHETSYDAMTDLTTAGLRILVKGTEAEVPEHQQMNYSILRQKTVEIMSGGENVEYNLLPQAFKAPRPVQIRKVSHWMKPMMPGQIGKDMVEHGI